MRKFEEEEEKPAEAAPETTEESAPDSHDQFITLLTEMGLSAEQAEAVHQMAMDLANSAPAEGEQKVEASRMRKRTYGAGKKRMGGSRAGRRRGFSEERPRGRRSSERRQFSDVERLERTVRRQRRQLSEMRRQLMEFGAQPGAAPTARRHSAPVSNEPLNVGGSAARQRVFNQLKDKFK